MNTIELAKELHKELEGIVGVKLTVDKPRELIDSIFNTIAQKVADGEKVTIIGFGDFDRVERKERNGRNPQTGEAMVIKAQYASKFKPAKALKELVKG